VTDTPASLALEELKVAALDAAQADPEDPKDTPARFVSALHMAYQAGASWAEIRAAAGAKEAE
jgi:hypothetical protein